MGGGGEPALPNVFKQRLGDHLLGYLGIELQAHQDPLQSLLSMISCQTKSQQKRDQGRESDIIICKHFYKKVELDHANQRKQVKLQGA